MPPPPYRTSRAAAGTCPRCRETLLPCEPGRLAIDGDTETRFCEKCGGVFANIKASKRILETMDRTLLEIGFQASLGKLEKQHDGRVLTCPECLVEMTKNRIEAAACEVDACPMHGTWFDAGELEDVMRAFERARKRGLILAREPPTKPHVPTAEELWEPPKNWADGPERGVLNFIRWLDP